MPRKGKRKTIARGIYVDHECIEVRVVRGGVPYVEYFPLGTERATLTQAWKRLKNQGETETPRAAAGSLRSDTPAYLRLKASLSSVDDIADHMEAWNAEIGHLPRRRIDADHIIRLRVKWLKAGLSPKTINNRVQTLGNLYHALDGRKAPSPVDDITRLPVPRTVIQRVSDAMILTVDQNLQLREQEATKQFDGAKTRARFRVFVSTGKRPIEIMRAEPGDVDLAARVWVPRDAKGGFTHGVYLNDDMLAAWTLFVSAGAWGPFSLSNFARVIRAAGWPATVRPYQARHTTWITASERGVDLDDIAAGAGHTDSRMTRRMYVPVLNSRLQRLSEALEGRFQGWPATNQVGAKSGGSAKVRKRR